MLLQTSPYLTLVRPGQPSLIVFAIDELQPVHPDVTPEDGAAFGVIGLDRKTVWHPQAAGAEVLQRCAAAPVDRSVLDSAYSPSLVSDLIGRGWLQRPHDLCREYLLTTAQIEITAHCNWGCAVCPVAQDPKPAATMPMPLFEEIIAKIKPVETIRYVTFHFYNEPTLDRFFNDRIAVLNQHQLRLRLFTNASHLDTQKIAALSETGVLDYLAINLPAVEPQELQELTRSRAAHKSIANADAAIAAGLPVSIVVNGSGPELGPRLEQLREYFQDRGVPVNPTLLSDRAGTLAGEYHQDVRVDGPLRGCGWPVNHAHFSVSGDMFLCCNDYYQREKFGNIQSGSVHDIMTGPAAILARRRVFGVAEAAPDYPCRTCHDQLLDFSLRQFRPLATFPLAPPMCTLERSNHA